LVNVVLTSGDKADLLSHDIRLYAVTSTSFDVSGLDYYLPLINGGLVCISSANDAKVGEISRLAIARQQVNCIQGTPSYWTLVTDSEFKLGNLKLLSAGEPLTRQLFDKLSSLTDLQNLYGPTEAAVYVTHHRIKDLIDINSIGTPIFNTQIHILDSNLNQVPIGAIGEIFIGGVGLARGYLNRPGLTAEKFIANPLSNKPGERLYRTGDLARYLPDGNIEFIGRVDHQVKIRGFRIELGEIESAISSVNGVKQVIVLAREDEPGQKRLVAYIVPNNQILLDEEGETKQQNLITDIRQECSKNLPDYMRPSQIMLLAEMPLTPNGKIDRKALPKPEGREGLEAYQAPQGIIENSLASIWKELLQVERVGRNDNFFHLGGNSLLLVKMLYMIKKLLNIQVSIKNVHHAESLASLANIIFTAHKEGTQINNITLDINKTTAKPIFLIHPIGGLSLPYVPLKKLLPEQHIIGINDPYFGHENSGFSTITDMSSHYVSILKTLYDPNNCILGGWSFGGEVAYRMACQLEEDGEKINKVILFDSFSPRIHNLLVHEEGELSDEQKSDYFFKQSMKRNSDLRKNEDLPKFCGQVYLFKSIAYDPKLSEVNKNIISQQKHNGWDEYCRNITVININLSHGELFEEKNLHILIQEIKNII
jgi:acyl carrier protein